MDAAVDPRRESKDPAVRSKADYLLDASYFNGRYYLYFGVTPAALFLLPYSLATGGDLDPRVLVVLFAVAGFLFSLGVLRMAARDLCWRTGGSFQAAAAACLAFATAVPSLLARSMFYEVAIAGGYAFTCAGMFWTYRALFGRGGPTSSSPSPAWLCPGGRLQAGPHPRHARGRRRRRCGRVEGKSERAGFPNAPARGRVRRRARSARGRPPCGLQLRALWEAFRIRGRLPA